MAGIDAVLSRAAGAAPDRIAVLEWQTGRRISYRELDMQVSACAGFLQARGVRRGERVGIHLPNGVAFLVAKFAALRAGAVATYINDRLQTDEVLRQLRMAEVSALFTTAGRIAAVRDQAGFSGLLTIATDGAPTGSTALHEIVVGAHSRRFEPPAGIEDADAILRFTSGSTGLPKGILVTHRAWLMRAIAILAEEARIDAGSTTMLGGPLTHAAGLLVLPTMLRHGTLLVLDRMDADSVAAALVAMPVHRTQMVPTVLRPLLENPGVVAALRRSQLHEILYGGSPIDAATLEHALAVLPDVSFVQVYGSHEAGSISHLDGPGHRDLALRESAGHPFLAAEIRVAKPEAGGWGEIEVRSPWCPRARITEGGREHIAEEWIRTGDLGEFRDGYIYLKDRANDVIVSGGFNVYPKEVEEVINRCAGVVTSAVISAPDQKWGERVLAYVVVRDRGVLEGDTLRAHCRNSLAGFKVPKEFIALDAIPVNQNGKLDRRALSAPMWRGHERRIN